MDQQSPAVLALLDPSMLVSMPSMRMVFEFSLFLCIPSAYFEFKDAEGRAMSNLVPTASSPVPYDVPPETSEATIKEKPECLDDRQLEALNSLYARTTFPSTDEHQQIERDVGMSTRSVQIWLVLPLIVTCIISELSIVLSGSKTKGRQTVKADKILTTLRPVWGTGDTTIRATTARGLGMFYYAG
jgi:hypothetical protein